MQSAKADFGPLLPRIHPPIPARGDRLPSLPKPSALAVSLPDLPVYHLPNDAFPPASVPCSAAAAGGWRDAAGGLCYRGLPAIRAKIARMAGVQARPARRARTKG
jgi:hypothetical protein